MRLNELPARRRIRTELGLRSADAAPMSTRLTTAPLRSRKVLRRFGNC